MLGPLHAALAFVTLILVMTGCAGTSKDEPPDGGRDKSAPQERGKGSKGAPHKPA
jgi:hypothetical protein